MGKLDDLTGRTFGRYTVIERTPNHVTSGGGKKTMYLCKCSCGTMKTVEGAALKNGRVKSCGCFNSEITGERFRKHGLRGSKAYSTWYGIKNRCFNKKQPRYKDYGGRGINLCKEWADSFQEFYAFVSKLPHAFEDGYSIDRINNDGNYEPGNVKFSTSHEQNMNRRNSHGVGCKAV